LNNLGSGAARQTRRAATPDNPRPDDAPKCAGHDRELIHRFTHSSFFGFSEIHLICPVSRNIYLAIPLRPKRCAGFIIGAGAGCDGPVASTGLSCGSAP
jgi:hypothetical protein